MSIAPGVFSLKDRAKTMTVRASGHPSLHFAWSELRGAEASGENYEPLGPGRR